MIEECWLLCIASMAELCYWKSVHHGSFNHHQHFLSWKYFTKYHFSKLHSLLPRIGEVKSLHMHIYYIMFCYSFHVLSVCL